MLDGEEEKGNMDKKNNCRQSSVPQPKGSGSDNKKDGSNNGNKQRGNHKRSGGEGNTNRPRNDQSSRRPLPKSRSMDKRPRSRGYCNDRQREEMTKDQPAELGSVVGRGSKKGNMNHLLNFTFAPRGDQYEAGGRGGGPVGWRGRGCGGAGGGRRAIKYNKEHFLQANCQFVVRETGDYTLHGVDPDTLVDWDLIEQVRIVSNEVPSCPICLYPPTAAKITRCGHTYCTVCMLHYLSLGEKHWRRCPICYESVHKKDLKSVVALETHHYAVGETISMKLMKRSRGSTYTMPKAQWTERESKPHHLNDVVDTCYAKLLLAGPDEIQEIIDREKVALEVQTVDEGSESLEGSYIHAALELIEERQAKLRMVQAMQEEVAHTMENLNAEQQQQSDDGHGKDDLMPPHFQKCASSPDVLVYASAFSDTEEDVEPTHLAEPPSSADISADESSRPQTSSSESGTEENVTVSSKDGENEIEKVIPVEVAAEELAMPSEEDLVLHEGETGLGAAREEGAVGARDDERGKNREETGGAKAKGWMTDTYYFYQAADGQHIYLHSVNARCLVREYGSLENCPDTITASIVELESINMTQELRKRLRYLNHMPVQCVFQVAELHLQPPLVSTESLSQFAGEIDRRRQTRQKKSRDESRKLKKIQVAVDKQMGIYPGMRAQLGNSQHFPECDTFIVPSEQATASHTAESLSNTSSALSTPVGSLPDSVCSDPPKNTGAEDSSSWSFAQMLRHGKAKTEGWPKPPTSESVTSPTRRRGGSESDGSEENADHVPTPMYRESFGDAIQAALDNYNSAPVVDTGDTTAEVTLSPGGKKKKGKKKKQLLFTTSMPRTK